MCVHHVRSRRAEWRRTINTSPVFVLAGGWHASTENTDKVECYNPKTNQWTMCAPMKERRYRPGAAVVDGKIYVLGGEEGWDR